MAELVDILADNILDRKVHIHDVVDEGLTLQLDSGVEVIYPCDPINGREYASNGALWDESTGIFSIPDGIIDSRIDVKWSFVINVGNAQTIVMRIFIPDGGGDIEVYSKTYALVSGDNILSNSTLFYIAAEALAAGFKVTLTPSVNVNIKGRSILIVA